MTKAEKQAIINLIGQYDEEYEKALRNQIKAREKKDNYSEGYFLGLSIVLQNILLDLNNLLKGC